MRDFHRAPAWQRVGAFHCASWWSRHRRRRSRATVYRPAQRGVPEAVVAHSQTAHTPNVRPRTLSALDEQIARLESELAGSSDEEPVQVPGLSRDDTRLDAEVERVAAACESHQLMCDVCGVRVTSLTLLREHMAGRKHVQAVKQREARLSGRYCEVCATAFTSEAQMTEHLNGRKHRERARAAAAARRTDHPGTVVAPASVTSGPP